MLRSQATKWRMSCFTWGLMWTFYRINPGKWWEAPGCFTLLSSCILPTNIEYISSRGWNMFRSTFAGVKNIADLKVIDIMDERIPIPYCWGSNGHMITMPSSIWREVRCIFRLIVHDWLNPSKLIRDPGTLNLPRIRLMGLRWIRFIIWLQGWGMSMSIQWLMVLLGGRASYLLILIQKMHYRNGRITTAWTIL